MNCRTLKKKKHFGKILSAALCLFNFTIHAQYTAFHPGAIWKDNNNLHINAHGGGIMFHKGTYYWYGENKGDSSNNALVGVMCYSSKDLYNWRNDGIALDVSEDSSSPIVRGCIIERPKVIYNEATKKFVMYFHLELRDQGYEAANVGIAVSDSPTGKFTFLKNSRVNAGVFPENLTKEQRLSKVIPGDFKDWWTPDWYKAVEDGLFVRRDFSSGQMSRDMTLFVDEDKNAYHIYSSEDNLTLHIAQLTDDYLNYTGKYMRIAPGGHNEAPAIFKKDGKYYMITSGCTGWDPNAARLFVSDSIFGRWRQYANPCKGSEAHLTFNSQGTYILPVAGKQDAFIFMADRWRPKQPGDGRYVWLPVLFENGMPTIRWYDEWNLDLFQSR